MQIPVEMCLGGRDLTEPTLSPDGRTMAFVARWGSSAAIVGVPADGGPERIVTTEPAPSPGRGLGGGCFSWHPGGEAVAYAAIDGNIWRQPMPGGAPTAMTDVDEGRRFQSPVWTPDGTAIVAVLDQSEVWYIGPDGRRRLDDGSTDFCLDPFVRPCGTTVLWTAWSVPDMPWDAAHVGVHVLADGAFDRFVGPASVHQPRTLPDGRGTGVRDDTGWLNVFVGDDPLVAEPVEHAGPTWGAGQRSYAASPDGTRIAFTRNERGFGRLCVATVGTGEVSEVARGVHGQLSWRGDRIGTLRTGARTPTQIVTYEPVADPGEANRWDRTVLAVGPVAGWEAADLPEPEAVTAPADDGATIHARRYVAGHGRTLCWIHGGPTDQWQVEFMPRVAYWWSRGWDVLVPDPRGSTGHGREYQQALRGRWGELDVADTAAVLAASHRRGWSDPTRTVMMGSSSGGLTALGVLGRHAGLAAGGVVLYPVVDHSAPADASHRYEAHYALTLVGPPDDVVHYRNLSPISYCERIDVPLLVMHGDADPVVPIASTLALVDRMRAADRDVELVVFEGEGHGFRDPANKRREYEATGDFLARVVPSDG